jgi:hypothetical protein
MRLSLFVALLFSASFAASAGPIIYDVAISTSTISGTAGSIDFNFSPGGSSQAASLQILNFMSDGTLAGNCPCGTGDVTGQLPSTLTFDNGTAFNDYFDQFQFGDTITFELSLFGPALSAPDGTSTSESTFAFSMFFDSEGTVPVLTNDMTDGFAFTVNVNLDGTTTVANYTTGTITPESSAPEPGNLVLSGTALAGCAALYLRRRRTR